MKRKTLAVSVSAVAAVAAVAAGPATIADAACPAGTTSGPYCTPSAAAVTTGAPTAVTTTTATLNGSVVPNGQATTYVFQYGPTTAYGKTTTAASAGADYTSHAVTGALTGLVPGTVYHARLVASNASNITAGADVAFKTAGTAPTTPTPTKPSADKPRPALSLSRPPRDTKKPYKYRAAGSLKRPDGATNASCSGTVIIRLTRAGKTVGRTTTKVSSSCRYAKSVSVSKKTKLPKSGSLLLKTRFDGNSALAADSASSRQVFFGPAQKKG